MFFPPCNNQFCLSCVDLFCRPEWALFGDLTTDYLSVSLSCKVLIAKALQKKAALFYNIMFIQNTCDSVWDLIY